MSAGTGPAPASRLRVVLDTNVLVSGFAYPNSFPGKIVQAVLSEALEAVVSQFILDETARVLPRFKQFHISAAESLDLLERLTFSANLVEPVPVIDTELRDPADRPVLGTLIASGANYLITGDKDLLVLAARYPIVTPAEFWQRHG